MSYATRVSTMLDPDPFIAFGITKIDDIIQMTVGTLVDSILSRGVPERHPSVSAFNIALGAALRPNLPGDWTVGVDSPSHRRVSLVLITAPNGASVLRAVQHDLVATLGLKLREFP